jgi:thymidylate synthase (FAD)
MHKNHVELIGWYGGDRAIARAAWTSTQADVNKKTDEQIRDLLVNKLWNNGSGKAHKTPFERGIVEFNITCEQPSHIHQIKHRIANVNGESARYKELKDKYYIPDDWSDIRATSLKGEYLEQHNGKTWKEILKAHTEISDQLYHASLLDLEKELGRKRAKESARFFKTMNSQITLSVMMNMSCFYNFYSLRADTAAQLEIQGIARAMLHCIKQIEGNPFRFTLEAFNL